MKAKKKRPAAKRKRRNQAPGGWIPASAVRFVRDGRGRVTSVQYRKRGEKGAR